jgi:hypothetical protein
MGKDKTDWKAENRWRTGQLNSKERDAMERYGLNPSDYGWDKSDNPGRHSGGDYGDMREDFLRAADNDYDTRRGIEAMALSGKKKAEAIAKGGFKTTGDVMNANNMQRKVHERMGNGGDFSSRSDFAGVSYNSVERDRRKQDEGYEKQFASKEFLDQKMKDLQNATKPDASEPVEYQESDEYAGAKQRLNDGTYDTTSSMFKSGVVSENPTTAFRDANESAPSANDQAKATSSYLEQYKEDMVKGGRIGEAKSQNLANAFNTVIGSDI